MKIPPEDEYLKIKHTIEQINGIFSKYASQIGIQNKYLFSPSLNNVVFASGEYSFMFTLESMVKKYQQKFKGVDGDTFNKILWGDYYFHSQTNKFSRKPQAGNKKRAFVEFILDPIYKIFSHTVGKDKADLEKFLMKNLKITLTADQYKMNVKTMIKLILNRYFKTCSCLVSSVVTNFPPPNNRIAPFL